MAQCYPIEGLSKDIPVSFLGSPYGVRPLLVNYLKMNGIPISTYGPGWESFPVKKIPDSYSKMNSNTITNLEIINRSIINLGFGGIGYSKSLTSLKGRDYEITGVGGGMYITSYNSDLAQHIVLGKEIICYSNWDELLELVRYYLNNIDEAEKIAAQARYKCIKKHRWIHRYQYLLMLLGLLDQH